MTQTEDILTEIRVKRNALNQLKAVRKDLLKSLCGVNNKIQALETKIEILANLPAKLEENKNDM